MSVFLKKSLNCEDKMYLLKYFLFLFLTQSYSAEELNRVEKAFIENEVVPDVTDVAPSKLLKVAYSDTAVVNLGNDLPITSVLLQPTFEWDAEPYTKYTLIMADPDAPSRDNPILRNVKHMLVINIIGNDLSTGDALAPYLTPTPPPLSGPHRYTFLLYKQVCHELHIEGNLITKLVDRFNFNVTEFAKKNNLILDAGNFFRTEILELLPTLI